MDTVLTKKTKNLKLKNFDPADTSPCKGGKAEAEARTDKLREELSSLQELIAANGRDKILIVLQGMDTAGKDGTIRKVFTGVNPQGVNVASFKTPTRIEAGHDFLWRIHLRVPIGGEIVIFNRSHYEDVLYPVVHKTADKKTIEKRYGHINEFEKMLTDEGTLILKFFLHIDRDEQTKRLRSRLETENKQWKLSAADIAEREFWKDYRKAYEKILTLTSTKYAPWHIVPANHKWYRDLYVMQALVDALKALKPKAPKPDYDPDSIEIK